jgi:hypothetical protein
MKNDEKATNKKIRSWLKENKYSKIRKVARPNPYPWQFWSAKFSTYAAILFLRLGLRPDHITFVWFILGIIASLFLWQGSLLFGLIFIVLYILTWYLDFVDGDMARIIRHVCPEYKRDITETWLDKIAYNLHKSLVLLGIGVNVYVNTGELINLFAGFTVAYLSLFDNYMKVRLTDALVTESKLDELKPVEYSVNKKSIKEYLIPIIRPEPISILTLAVIFSLLDYALYFYLVLYFLYFLSSFKRIYKKLLYVRRD